MAENDVKAPEKARAYDKSDVKRALERETDDGPGDLDSLPESDWVSYAEDGVEVETEESP